MAELHDSRFLRKTDMRKSSAAEYLLPARNRSTYLLQAEIFELFRVARKSAPLFDPGHFAS
jgi:hypothetical protein